MDILLPEQFDIINMHFQSFIRQRASLMRYYKRSPVIMPTLPLHLISYSLHFKSWNLVPRRRRRRPARAATGLGDVTGQRGPFWAPIWQPETVLPVLPNRK